MAQSGVEPVALRRFVSEYHAPLKNRINTIRLLVLGLFLLFLTATPALAHANLVRSEPAANSAQPVSPKVVRVWFSEAIEPSFSTLRVVDKSGTAVDQGDAHRLGNDATAMEVSLGNLPDGLYTVVWKNTSTVDGHVLAGSFSFTVGAVPLADASPRELMGRVDSALAAQALPPLYQVLVRWLNIVLLALAVGGLLFPVFVLFPAIRLTVAPSSVTRVYWRYLADLTGRPLPATGAASQRAASDGVSLTGWTTAWRRAARIDLVLLAVMTVATLFAQALTAGNSLAAVGQVLVSTRFGEIWIVRAAAVIGLIVLLFRGRWNWIAGSPARDRRLWLAVFLGFVLLVTQSLNSHGAAIADPPIVPFLADLVHLLGVVVWVGGLVQLLVTLPALVRDQPAERQMRVLASVIATFSFVAFITVGLVVLSGAFSMVVEVGSQEAFFGTLYGMTLLAKVLLILPLLALGALNLIVTRPAAAHAAAARVRPMLVRLDLAVGLEAALAAAVLLAVGLLTSVAPATSAYDPSSSLWMETHRAGDLNVTLGIAPALVGTNDFDVKVRDAAGRPVANATVVRLLGTMREMDMGIQQATATNQGDGHYTLHGDLMSMVGTWQLDVLVRRAGVDDVRTSFSLLAIGQRLPQPASPLTNPQALAALGLTLFGFAIGTASALVLKPRRLRRATLGGAIVVSLVGAFVAFQVSANAPSTAFVVPVVPEFARLARSPVAPVPAQIAAGRQTYQENCATCHGLDGKGDGPAAANLLPKPADLTVHVPLHTEGELYWWITNGITTTAMPAWNTRLTDLQRWQVVVFLRSEFGSAGPAPASAPPAIPPAVPKP